MINKNDVLNAYIFRHACKAFDPEKKIGDDDFNYILETARLSPSSFGWEPWKFIIIQNPEVRARLKEVAWGAQGQLDTASHFMLMAARKTMDTKAGSDYIDYMAREIQHLPEDIVEMKLGFYKNFQEKDFDLTDDRKLFDWASKQIYIPLANMMTAAAMIGIDSCPMEGFDMEKIEAILKEEEILDTDQFGLSVMVAFGYRPADLELRDKTRQPQDKVVEWIK